MAVYTLIWTHPSVRRHVTKIGLNGDTLRQEVLGTQQQERMLVCASLPEYVEAVRTAEVAEFVNNLQVQAPHTVQEGIQRFNVQIGGERNLPAETTDDGSYVYTPGN